MEVGKQAGMTSQGSLGQGIVDGAAKIAKAAGNDDLQVEQYKGRTVVSLDLAHKSTQAGSFDKKVQATLDPKGQLVIATRVSGNCFPHTSEGASDADLAALHKAVGKAMKAGGPDAADLKALHKALGKQLETQKNAPQDKIAPWLENLGTHKASANQVELKPLVLRRRLQ